MWARPARPGLARQSRSLRKLVRPPAGSHCSPAACRSGDSSGREARLMRCIRLRRDCDSTAAWLPCDGQLTNADDFTSTSVDPRCNFYSLWNYDVGLEPLIYLIERGMAPKTRHVYGNSLQQSRIPFGFSRISVSDEDPWWRNDGVVTG